MLPNDDLGLSSQELGERFNLLAGDAKEYADFNNDFAAWGQAQMKAGKTVEAAAAEYKVPDWYRARGFTVGGRGAGANLQVIYNELGKK